MRQRPTARWSDVKTAPQQEVCLWIQIPGRETGSLSRHFHGPRCGYMYGNRLDGGRWEAELALHVSTGIQLQCSCTEVITSFVSWRFVLTRT